METGARLVDKIKFPRTTHLPWSPGYTGDDVRAQRVDIPLGTDVVVTEKLDGENTSVGRNFVHARSTFGRRSESLGFARNVAAGFQLLLPTNLTLVFENLYAVHSIHYDIEPRLVLIAAYKQRADGVFILSWDEITDWGNEIGQRVAPVLYRGDFVIPLPYACFTGRSVLGGEQEGYVVRLAGEFPLAKYDTSVFKYVRAGHVADNAEHWMNKPIVRQGQ